MLKLTPFFGQHSEPSVVRSRARPYDRTQVQIWGNILFSCFCIAKKRFSVSRRLVNRLPSCLSCSQCSSFAFFRVCRVPRVLRVRRVLHLRKQETRRRAMQRGFSWHVLRCSTLVEVWANVSSQMSREKMFPMREIEVRERQISTRMTIGSE